MAPTRVLLRLLAGAVAKRGKGQIPSFFGNMYAEIVSSANLGAEKAQNNQEPARSSASFVWLLLFVPSCSPSIDEAINEAINEANNG